MRENLPHVRVRGEPGGRSGPAALAVGAGPTPESTLLGQPFIKDDKQSVEKMLAARKSKILAYRFLVVGEGIVKKSSDFAAEVAAMAPKG